MVCSKRHSLSHRHPGLDPGSFALTLPHQKRIPAPVQVRGDDEVGLSGVPVLSGCAAVSGWPRLPARASPGITSHHPRLGLEPGPRSLRRRRERKRDPGSGPGRRLHARVGGAAPRSARPAKQRICNPLRARVLAWNRSRPPSPAS